MSAKHLEKSPKIYGSQSQGVTIGEGKRDFPRIKISKDRNCGNVAISKLLSLKLTFLIYKTSEITSTYHVRLLQGLREANPLNT